MKIVSIEWLSREGKEAVVHIDSHFGLFYAFCHPCCFDVSDAVYGKIYCMSASNMSISQGSSGISMNSDGSCVVVGVINEEGDVVVGGSVRVEVDINVSDSFSVGDLVQFSCGRLDLW